VTQTPTPGNTGATLLGRGAWEASQMQATVVNATKIMIVGDFNYFLVLDRIGMNIELIPFLFGSGQGNLPTGPARPLRLVEEHLEGALRLGVRRDDGDHLDRRDRRGRASACPRFPSRGGAMAKAHTHGKNALTGKGQVEKAPTSGAKGPSNHVPTVGKPQPHQAANYSSQQQQG
jgi:hypothetical protein